MVERMKIVSTENFDWCLPDSDTHFAEMLSINSEYQFKIKNIILEYAHLLNFENTIDVGANIGLWARWLSQQGAKNIDCFEPIAKNLECLRKNVQDIQNLNIHEVALGTKKGSLTLYIEKSESNVGQHTINRNYFGESALIKGYTVPVESLDSYSLTPTFIKIDVQGAEMMVLEGAADTIKKYRPSICIECEDEELTTIKFLQSLDYQVVGNTKSDFLMVPL
jgi:FkbM family methyltransferase